MKFMVTAAFMALIGSAALAQERPEPNSQYFDTSGYIHPTSDGNWARYQARGYIQKGAAETNPAVFLLPQVYLDTQSIEFIGENGLPFDPEKDPDRKVQTIAVRALIDRSMPTPFQEPAIAGAILGQPEPNYIADVQRGPNGHATAPEVMEYGFGVSQSVNQASFEQMRMAGEQKARVQSTQLYKRVPVSMDGMQLALTIDGDEVASRSFPGSVSTNGRLPALKVSDPTPYQVGRLISGGAELVMRYRFKDSKTSQIDAQFDTELLINRFLEVHKRMVTRQRASGFRFLGISFRSRSVRQSVDEYINSNFNGSLMERTIIVMDDANEAMVARFQDAFFPILSRQQTIDNHLAAAQAARNEGKTQLAELHEKYAASLTTSVDLDSVDMAAAAAALAAQDYAGFLAAGVRAGSDSSSATSEFRKLDRSETNITQQRTWIEAQRVTVSREISSIVQPVEQSQMKPFLGVCNAAQFTYIERLNNFPYPPHQIPGNGIIATCVMDGGPFARAGIAAGSVIMSIDGKRIGTEQQLGDLLNRLRPGQTVPVRIFRPQMMQPNSGSQTYRVKLLGRPALD